MSDQRDNCPICLEAFAPCDSFWPFYGGPFAPGRLLCWPCGHRVHIACILRSQASLGSIEAPCFLCRTPAFPQVRSAFEHFHGAEIALVPADAPPPNVPPPVPVHAVYIPPKIAALCCPRVLPFSRDRRPGTLTLMTRTSFVDLQDDRRMTFMGLDRGTGAMQWTCLSCNRQLSLLTLPSPQQFAAHVCHRHGEMCFTFDCRGAEPLLPFWSCMDNRASRNDVPLPISHLRTIDAHSMPIEVASSDDEQSIDWSSTGSSGFDMEDTEMHMDRLGLLLGLQP